jgi:hypothetical protein
LKAFFNGQEIICLLFLDGDSEILKNENGQLIILNFKIAVIADRSRHNKKMVLRLFDLWPLVTAQNILHFQSVNIEMSGQILKKLFIPETFNFNPVTQCGL